MQMPPKLKRRLMTQQLLLKLLLMQPKLRLMLPLLRLKLMLTKPPPLLSLRLNKQLLKLDHLISASTNLLPVRSV